MRIAGAWNPKDVTPAHIEAGERALAAAYDAGYTLFDHADIYAQGVCEKIHGDFMRKSPSLRRETVIATKCGIRFPGDPHPDSPHRYDFSAKHILRSCDLSLQRLGIEQIDLYQLHRPDYLMNPSEVAEAFNTLYEQGKVRSFGVSNFRPSYVEALASACPFPILVNQVEIHLARLDCFEDGTLDQCLAKQITPLAWSPLAGGMLGDGREPPADHPKAAVLRETVALLDRLAKGFGVTRAAVALAWLMKHPSGIIPIVGSTKPDSIKAAAEADNLELDREDWYRILVAARGKGLP